MHGRHNPLVALVSARAAQHLDEDLPPLQSALRDAAVDVQVVNWDDDGVNWSAFDLALLRSTWDYSTRLVEFLAWAERVSQSTTLCNALPVVRWNLDKHYLAQLAQCGVATVPSEFVEPAEDAAAALAGFLAIHSATTEIVVKPAIGSGSREAERHLRTDQDATLAHMQRLLVAGQSVMLQPYLDRVDVLGETALIFFDGKYSHSIRKGALLQRGAPSTRALFAPEKITARTPAPDELRLAGEALRALPFGQPLYARVDLIRDALGAPCVLELELAEPSLFFAHAPGAAERFSSAIKATAQALAAPSS